jgi:hypothetical protein
MGDFVMEDCKYIIGVMEGMYGGLWWNNLNEMTCRRINESLVIMVFDWENEYI